MELGLALTIDLVLLSFFTILLAVLSVDQARQEEKGKEGLSKAA